VPVAHLKLLPVGSTIAKSKNPSTFAKRQREQEKKRKASEKLQRRQRRKTTRSDEAAYGVESGDRDDS
jgi:hypothetical protein